MYLFGNSLRDSHPTLLHNGMGQRFAILRGGVTSGKTVCLLGPEGGFLEIRQVVHSLPI